MRSLIRSLSIAVAITIAAPTLAGDASDTWTEKKSEARKTARDLKPGEKTAGDHVEDAKDTARASSAKARKKARHARKKAKQRADDATK